MQTDETRALVQRFLDARADNDADEIREVLAEDAEWHPPASAGIGPFFGREEVTKALTGGAIGKILDIGTVQRDVHTLVVEGDIAVALQKLSARTLKGAEYVNEYAWVYRCADGRIRRLDEYADTLHAGRVFGWIKS